MVFSGEFGQSVGDQVEKGATFVSDFSSDTWKRQERVLFLHERILNGSRKGRRKAKREFDDLLAQQEALNAADLETVRSEVAFSQPVEQAETVPVRSAGKSELARRTRQLLVAGTIAASAAAVGAPMFEAHADEPPPLPNQIIGQIGSQTRIDFIKQKDEGIYSVMPLGLQKVGPDPSSLAWTRFIATGGDIVNGWVKGLEQFKAKITGTLAQCADMIVWTNRSSFSDSEKQSSARRMNTNASPVLVSVQPTVTVNGKMERNYCAVNNPDLLRIQPTRTPPAVVPPPASMGQHKEDENRQNTLFGGAIVTSVLGLGVSVFLWIRRRNQTGAGLTSMVHGQPNENTHRMKSSIPVTKPERLDSPLDAAAAQIADSMTVAQIRDLNMTWEGLADYVGDKYAAIKAQLIKSRSSSGNPPVKQR